MPNEEMGSRAIPQPPDVATGTVILSVAGFLSLVAVAMIALFFYLKVGAPTALRQPTQHDFPKPALQTSPKEDLARVEFEQRTGLSGYAWIDRSKGLARIPIDEAMRIVAAKGDHAYDALEPSTTPSDPAKPEGVRP
ncbi:MAG TPA: hypothetical protein VJV58_00210 [Bradyrhizobium sp.]|jgi:hypothetical protein|uniref:hypothetical protein n=1 Tax=Bradyrhizobium sp. TaxID=376 RepID=UPI002B48FF1E|nr:hypothetical protein [Bradyrhizobium sp.]HKO69331.1 hypothetical protein [Bradyrhizobium sp.]